MNLIERFRSLGRLDHRYSDPYEELRAHGLLRLSLFVTIIALVYLPFLLLSPNPPLLNAVFAFLLLVAIGGLYGVRVMVNRGQLVTASLAFIIIVFVAVVASFVTSPTPSNLIAFSLPIVLAGALLNRRGMIVMMALVLIALLGTAVFNLLGLFTNYGALDLAPSYNLIVSGVVLVFNALVLITFVGGQRHLQRRNFALTRELRSSNVITQTLASIQSLEKLLDEAVILIRDHLNSYHVRVFLLEEKTNLLVLRAGTTFSGHTSSQARRIAPDDPSVLNEVVRDGNTLMITLSTATERRSEMLSGMMSQTLIPIRREDRILGVLDIQNASEDQLVSQDVEVLESIATQIALSVHNVRLYEELQGTTKDRQQLTEQLRLATREIEQLNQEVTGRAWTRYLEGRTDSVIGYDWREGNAFQSVKMTPSIERALQSALPEIQPDGNDQVLSVPIIWRGQSLGAMEFRAPAGRQWNERSIELAHVVSQRLALALDNIRLFEQAQILASREQTANQIAANLQANTDLDALVKIAADAFQKALGASRTSVRLGLPLEKAGENGSHTS
jgi:GAF domain-containing protein